MNLSFERYDPFYTHDVKHPYQNQNARVLFAKKLHDHNNAFCSAECCKAYKKKEDYDG
jgi:hypothetical protein